MLSKQDFKQLEKKFATKQDLVSLEVRIETKLERLDKKSQERHNEVITLLSDTMGELQTMRDEITVFNYRQSKHSDQLENHEGRLAIIEQQPNFQ